MATYFVDNVFFNIPGDINWCMIYINLHIHVGYLHVHLFYPHSLSLALFLNAGERAWIEYVDSLLLYLPLSEIPSHHFFNAIYVLEDMQINMFNLSLSLMRVNDIWLTVSEKNTSRNINYFTMISNCLIAMVIQHMNVPYMYVHIIWSQKNYS